MAFQLLFWKRKRTRVTRFSFSEISEKSERELVVVFSDFQHGFNHVIDNTNLHFLTAG